MSALPGRDKRKGGKYLQLPPGYKGDVPDGYYVLLPATFSVWFAWRSFLVDGDAKPGVDMVKKSTKIYPTTFGFGPKSAKLSAVTLSRSLH